MQSHEPHSLHLLFAINPNKFYKYFSVKQQQQTTPKINPSIQMHEIELLEFFAYTILVLKRQ